MVYSLAHDGKTYFLSRTRRFGKSLLISTLEAYFSGEKEEKDSGDGKYVVYLGRNDMCVILSNERSRSKGGDYRRYVTLDYVQTEINGRQSAKSDDDL